jgi:hypothetical protein
VPVKVYGNNAHGGHANYLKVPANTLVPLPDELSFSAAAAIACGSGTAYSALRRINLSGNDTIAIFEPRLGQSADPPRRSAFRGHVDDGFGKILRRFLGQVVTDAALDRSV